MKKHKHMMIVIAFIIGSSKLLAVEQISNAKIARMMQATGTLNNAQVLMNQIVRELQQPEQGKDKQKQNEVAQKVYERMKQDVDNGKYFETMKSIYVRFLTEEDVQHITAFYESPTGQRMVKAMPYINDDIIRANMDWAKSIILEVDEKIRTQ